MYLQQFCGQLPALPTVKQMSVMCSQAKWQRSTSTTQHITLSTVIIFRHCSLGQLLTFLIAFLSAMQCPACDRLLPKNFFADSLWRWQQGGGPEPDWVWCCRACELQKPVGQKTTWWFWKKFLYQFKKLERHGVPELLEEYSQVHRASLMFNDLSDGSIV